MRALLLLLFLSFLLGCSPAESYLKEKIESNLKFANLSEVESLVFKYAKKHSSNHFFLVYAVSESDFSLMKNHLVNSVGFKKFETSSNGFDVHFAFPEKQAWNQKVEYSEKKMGVSERCSLFYLPGSSTLIVEYFDSR